MAGVREKVFKDAVHGYIRVPSEWCDRFIDTPMFQRLRHIEQTSMRCLYPSARHDRFIHSLGVYHLGSKAFASLVRNGRWLTDELGLSNAEIESLRTTFLIACLLHDCAHAPYSHTFENYYDRQGHLTGMLAGAMSSDATADSDLSGCNPAAHEKASALLILEVFGDKIRELQGDPCLAARMVMGCEYHATSDPKRRLCNALISLLNGKAIDVDKLDYITRDTWASGVANVAIDIERLLASITVVSHPSPIVRIAYLETALSVIQSVVDARNFLYAWIYGHHKVVYDQYLLTTAVEKVVETLDESGLATIFSIEALSKPVQVGPVRLLRPSDGDIIHILKCHGQGVTEADEWLSRRHSRTALWKTGAQYGRMFEKLNESELNIIERALFDKRVCGRWWESRGHSDVPIVRSASFKLYEIHENDLLLELSPNKAVISYTDAVGERATIHNARMPRFYLYVPNAELRNRQELEEAVIALA